MDKLAIIILGCILLGCGGELYTHDDTLPPVSPVAQVTPPPLSVDAGSEVDGGIESFNELCSTHMSGEVYATHPFTGKSIAEIVKHAVVYKLSIYPQPTEVPLATEGVAWYECGPEEVKEFPVIVFAWSE